MRRQALAYLACPNCGLDLTLASVGVEEDAHVMQGELVCAERRIPRPQADAARCEGKEYGSSARGRQRAGDEPAEHRVGLNVLHSALAGALQPARRLSC